MIAQRARMVVICVDGGLPSLIRQHDFFNLAQRLPSLAGTAVQELRSIYPSSTAPSHASFLTGAYPRDHGIVGNRFWETEAPEEIRRRADDPLAAFHPYEKSSLTAPDLLDWLAEQGASMAAVHFPHTFSRSAELSIPSCYCLYAPAREAVVTLEYEGSAEARARVELSYFGHPLALRVRVGGEGVTVLAGDDGEPTVLRGSEPVRLDVRMPWGSLSAAVSVRHLDRREIGLSLGTAVITLGFGGLDPARYRGGTGPASLSVEYSANPDHDFHESPRAEWVERAALDILADHDPDVLFVRFNQADHAQEFLYWHAVRSNPEARETAWKQILDVYTRIDACVGRLAEAVGDRAEFVLFSDHGIDWVESHLRPNRLLQELGLADRMVFQGDSNCAYLYTAEPLTTAEERTLREGLRRFHPSVAVLTTEDQTRLNLPVGSPRVGRLTVTCGRHTEFQYGPGKLQEEVTSASHGYLPGDPAMNGFYRAFGTVAAHRPPPSVITGAATVIRDVWRRLTVPGAST
ncbi:alkaline phosphatase family protein [Streptomyces clavuligerus]|uniref:Type I phosphodiesterase/nucleotide pyrophosphatase n=1 Tax=Streptomyces clavuligerus TaxID=1901 RepID=E2Q6Q5_STRCL|nr:alkaline phosphatase family protein [Streptomyces clavuligerus]ANW18065.1 nucleotide pyrophosphatase [Streptomyces clavuligerus]AXU12624.1 nucleotide pyrophosphatase [Streptomyces clavuligerus]EFG09354.1 Type I phosphodiesterase/nucleotide pyrophosphatase [Streptomyces clavuligerus]MBY6302526.1 alkaline phosphatase family protein [Streptomyces clavuligerus]QCS05405.1 nucleotide pyrophosphatase [Streptomyces clavuligerus]